LGRPAEAEAYFSSLIEGKKAFPEAAAVLGSLKTLETETFIRQDSSSSFASDSARLD